MKRIVLVILTLAVLTGCLKFEKTSFKIDKLTVPYGEKTVLEDIVTIEEGTFVDQNQSIDTMNLGSQKIEFQYYNDKGKLKKYHLKIDVIDTEAPLIFNATKYYTKIGDKIDLIGRVIYGDNSDRNVKIKVVGEYDTNVVGDYPLRFVATDSSGNQKVEEFTLSVVEKYPNGSQTSDVKIETFIQKYKEKNNKIGIDVSSWQEDVDYEKVKQAGVEFVMIRIGYGHKDDKNVIDRKFSNNIRKAKDAGLPVGVYFYSYAKTGEEAVEQANWVIETLQGQELDLPIAFDWEIWEQFSSLGINFVDLNHIGDAFLKTIEEKGYQAMLYGSKNYLNRIWDLPQYPTWVAHYTEQTNYNKPYQMWQVSDHGVIDGIKGYVDLDILYRED